MDTASYSASSQPVDDGSGRTTQELPLNSTVELLEPRATFDFTVDFENLSQAELGCLLLALDVAQQWTGTRHKLGMGKPLGLGTVHVEIRDGVEIDRVARYRSLMDTGEHPLQVEAYLEAFRTALEQANGGTPFQEMRNIADLRALLDASHALQEIRYPAGAAADEGFRWFQSHRDQPLCTVQDSDATSCRQST